MTVTNGKKPIKTLFRLSRNRPLDIDTLRANGISSNLASYYVRNGWLTRLGVGYFMFPNDHLDASDTVAVLANQIPGLYVGGKTALAWRGVCHNVALGGKIYLSLWGKSRFRLPEWLQKHFPCDYKMCSLFDADLPQNFEISLLPEEQNEALASSRERAMLEMLSEVGVGQGAEEARNIMENIRRLRVDILTTLLQHCTRVKVVRLCLQWAQELALPWAAEIRASVGIRGTGRWITKLPDGSSLILKP